MSIFRRTPPKDWEAIDAENDAAMELLYKGLSSNDPDELLELWQAANKLVGQRAPSDRAPFLVYGYLQGKADRLTHERLGELGRRAAVDRVA